MKNFVPLYLLWEESVTFVSATINMHDYENCLSKLVPYRFYTLLIINYKHKISR